MIIDNKIRPLGYKGGPQNDQRFEALSGFRGR